MDHKQREQIERAIEACKGFERKFKAIRGVLEIGKACDDINVMTEQLQAINEETKRAMATVTDINEARKTTKH